MTKTFCKSTAHIPIRHPETENNVSQTLGNHNTEVSIYCTLLQHLPKRLLQKPSYPSHSQTNQHPPDVSIWPGSHLRESHSFIIALTQRRIRDTDSWSDVPKPNLSTQRLAITLKPRNFPQALWDTLTLICIHSLDNWGLLRLLGPDQSAKSSFSYLIC